VKAEAVEAIDRFAAEASAAGLMPPETWKGFPRDAATMTLPELLAEIGTLALGKLRALLLKDREIRDDDGNIVCPMEGRVERLELDLALGAAKLFARVSESALSTQGSDKLQEILEAIGNEAAAGNSTTGPENSAAVSRRLGFTVS
jgi:hypothetical protein